MDLEKMMGCRTPHGVRGLKFVLTERKTRQESRTPHGVRGLKCQCVGSKHLHLLSRTPHGVRGLKFTSTGLEFVSLEVAPHTGCVD